MAARVRISEQDMQNVTGGAFNFYSKGDTEMCYIDGLGTYYCSPEASAWAVSRITKGMSPADVIAEAVQEGMFWK
ncbi:MAG: hypothetical protein E7317_04190 [Clostridiales bacterium]|nr:hypothetical protein [Clostridiales bacterium]